MEKKKIYLFFGEDELPVAEAAKKIIDNFLPSDKQLFGLEIADGRVQDASSVADVLKSCKKAASTMSFFGENKVVWLRDANFFAEGGGIRRSEFLEKEIQLLKEWIEEEMPDSTIFIITAAKIDKRSSFYKFVENNGMVTEFVLPSKPKDAEAELREKAEEFLDKTGCKMEEDALEMFLGMIEKNTRNVISELEKLVLYVGTERKINVQDVRNIVSLSREAVIWNLTDFVIKRRIPEVLILIKRLIAQKESPIGIIAILQRHFRDLAVIREAIDNGWAVCQRKGWHMAVAWKEPDSAALKLFHEVPELDPRKINPWRAGILAEQANMLTLPVIIKCRNIIIDMYKRLFSGNIGDELILEWGMLRLIKTISKN